MAHEDDIHTLVKGINESIAALSNKPTINTTTLLTSLIGTLLIGAFMFYIGMVKFTANITHDVNDNAAKILDLKTHSATKAMFNTHNAQENYNFRQIGKKLDVEFIVYKPLK